MFKIRAKLKRGAIFPLSVHLKFLSEKWRVITELASSMKMPRSTVLEKKRNAKKPHESTSLPSIQKIFFLETFYISPKLRKKF